VTETLCLSHYYLFVYPKIPVGSFSHNQFKKLPSVFRSKRLRDKFMGQYIHLNSKSIRRQSRGVCVEIAGFSRVKMRTNPKGTKWQHLATLQPLMHDIFCSIGSERHKICLRLNRARGDTSALILLYHRNLKCSISKHIILSINRSRKKRMRRMTGFRLALSRCHFQITTLS